MVAVARTAQSIAFQSRPCRLRLSLSEKRGASPRILSFCSISLAYFLRFSRTIGFQRKTLQLIIGRKRNAHAGFIVVLAFACLPVFDILSLAEIIDFASREIL